MKHIKPNCRSSKDVGDSSPSSDTVQDGRNTQILFSYINYFQSYYGNPILSPYVMSWIGFRPPQIEPILYLCTIDYACITHFYVDNWYMYLQWKPALSSLYMSFSSDIVSVDILDSGVVLIFPSRVNHVDHRPLVFQYRDNIPYKVICLLLYI